MRSLKTAPTSTPFLGPTGLADGLELEGALPGDGPGFAPKFGSPVPAPNRARRSGGLYSLTKLLESKGQNQPPERQPEAKLRSDSSMGDDEHTPIRNFLAPNIMPVYQAVAEAVGDALGILTELVVETSYDNCRNDINDVCFVCSLPYVMFEREGIQPAIPCVAPVLRGARYGNKPIYFSDVVVSAHSPARRFSDLRGKSWAFNEPLSHSGYGITRHRLVEMGETSGFFSEVIEAGFHETAIEMVRDGMVEASAINSQVLEVAIRDTPGLSDSIRIIDTLGPSTIQPIAISKRIEPGLRDRVIDVILRLHEDASARSALDAGLVDHFGGISAGSYDDIRLMVDDCERADFMVLR